MRRRLVGAVLVVLLLAVAGVTARVFVWPSLSPLPPKVDAVVELGGPGDRDGPAVRLARAGRTDYLVQSTTLEEAGTDRCLPGSPGVTVLCFHADPSTTRGEAQYIGELAKLYHWRSVVLVTSPDQAWRARLRTIRCFDGAVYNVTTPLPIYDWPLLIPYQWGASIKALTVERGC